MPEKRLGKGLEALINTHSTENRLVDGSVSIKNIIPNHNQPRQDFDKEEMDNLSKSIKRNGILQPLTVREIDDEKYIQKMQKESDKLVLKTKQSLNIVRNLVMDKLNSE